MLSLFAILGLAGLAQAHISIWNKGMFGLNYPGQAGDAEQNYNNQDPIGPLKQDMRLTTDKWFGHGYKSYPPKAGDFMELESGGTFMAELACNRAWTTLRDPRRDGQDYPFYACDGIGALHVMNTYGQEPPDVSKFGGTALAIAYTSDISALQPGDMTVISVNYTSVWYRETAYKIPSGMPPCPAEGCLCSWNWIHQANHGEGYGQEIYNTLLRCKITGNTNSAAVVPRGVPPTLCEGDPSNCTAGPKQPMYLWQVDGNNMPETFDNPTYNARYGFVDGAQQDAVVNSGGAAPVPSVVATSTSLATTATLPTTSSVVARPTTSTTSITPTTSVTSIPDTALGAARIATGTTSISVAASPTIFTVKTCNRRKRHIIHRKRGAVSRRRVSS